jgi:hypothetical protein
MEHVFNSTYASPYSTNERLAVIIVKTTAAFLTTITSFIFLVYVVIESFRKKIYRNMAIRFLTYLQFSSMMAAIGNIYVIHTSRSVEKDFMCYLEALQTQFFDWAVFLWTFCIGSFLLITVVFAIPSSKKYSLFLYLFLTPSVELSSL